jgi:hypothetical protein
VILEVLSHLGSASTIPPPDYLTPYFIQLTGVMAVPIAGLGIVQRLLQTLPLLEVTEQITHSLTVIPSHLQTSLCFFSCGAHYLLITERVVRTGFEPVSLGQRPLCLPFHHLTNAFFCLLTDYKRLTSSILNLLINPSMRAEQETGEVLFLLLVVRAKFEP